MMEQELPLGEITISELDAAVSAMVTAKNIYEEAKERSNQAHAQMEMLKEKLLKMLEATGKSSYKVDGLGTVSKVEKMKVSMPSTPEEKDAFFTWLQGEGKDMFTHYTTVNYNSLNSLYNMKYEEAKDKSTFKIPGIAEPEVSLELRFRKN